MHTQICADLDVLCCLVKKHSQSLPVLVYTHTAAFRGVTRTWTRSLTAKAGQERDSPPGGGAPCGRTSGHPEGPF